ncbi:MAG: hypothetical protein ACOX4L_05055 [Bacillota bacterium]|jgi:trigger factor
MTNNRKEEMKKTLILGPYCGLTVELGNMLDKNNKTDKIEGLISAILSNCTFFIDESQIDHQATMLIERFKAQIADSNITFEEYLKQSGKDYATLFNQLRVIALEGMKKDLLITEIALREKISVSEAEMIEKIKEFARIAGKPQEEMYLELQKRGQVGTVFRELLWEKTIDFLIENNNFR